MQAGDEAFEQLRRAIEDLADGEVAELVAEARIEARAKVRAILAEAMAQALLERAQTEMSPGACRPLRPLGVAYATPAGARRGSPRPARRATTRRAPAVHPGQPRASLR